MKIVILYLILMLGMINESFSQDVHFSNYSAVPVFLNPATTGFFDGKFRLITAYKSQWGSFANPYKTFYSSLDVNFSDGKVTNKIIGASLSFYNDKAGTSQMGTSQANLSVACNIQLNENNFLGAGIKAGIAQMSYSTNILWDSQYSNGIIDPGVPSGESNLNSSFNYLDFGTGLLWSFNGENELKSTTGISVNKTSSPFLPGAIDRPYKIAIHSTAQIPISNGSTFLIPYFSYINHTPNQEFNIGSIFKYDMGLNSKYTGRNFASAVYLGAIYRYQDAVIVITKLDLKQFLSLSFSYDINVSALNVASQRNGGPELSISYIGHIKGRSKTDKTFL